MEQTSDDLFRTQLGQNARALVVFTMKGCPHCRALKPVLESVGRDHPGAHVLLVDDEQCQQLSRIFRVQSVPALFLLTVENGRVTSAETVGRSRRELSSACSKTYRPEE